MAVNPKGQKPQLPAQITTSDLQRHSQELGKLGTFFGSKEHAPIYLAGILGLLSLVGAIGVGIFAAETPGKADLIKALIGIVIAALSFIGGASGRSQN